MVAPQAAASASGPFRGISPGARITILPAAFSANAAATIARWTASAGDAPMSPASTSALPAPGGNSREPHHEPPTCCDTSSRRAAAERAASSGVSQPRVASSRAAHRISAGEPGPLMATAVALSSAAAPSRQGGARNRPPPRTIAGTLSAAARVPSPWARREPCQAASPASGGPLAKSGNSATRAAGSSGPPRTANPPRPIAAAGRAARGARKGTVGFVETRSGCGMSATRLGL